MKINERLVLVFNDPNCGMDFELKLPDVWKLENKHEMSIKMKMFIYRFVYPLFTGAYYMVISGENAVDCVKYDKSKAVIDDYLQWVDTDMTADDIYEYVLKRTEYIYVKNKNEAKHLAEKRLSKDNNK